MAAINPASSDKTTIQVNTVDRTTLSHTDAAKLLNAALEAANQVFLDRKEAFQVVYNGQPHCHTKGETTPEKINPEAPIDLALLYNDGTVEPIDIVDIVEFTKYRSDYGRLTSGFKSVDDFSQEIVLKVERHLASIKNPYILISQMGSKYNIEPLTKNTLSIDPHDYIRVNGMRVAYFLDKEAEMQPKVLLASGLRGSGILQLDERSDVNRIYIYEPDDPAPRFYVDLSKVIQVTIDSFPAEQQIEAKLYDDQYLLLGREPGKI